MRLNDETIKEFQAIYYRQYGVQLSDDIASIEASNLIALVAGLQPRELNND
ncbi:MAG: hypothetical protein ABIQ04_01625 [Candidatus Saccharimonadales bacterium]